MALHVRGWTVVLAILLVSHGSVGADESDPTKEAALREAAEADRRLDESFGDGRFAEALLFARRLLELREKALGTEHPDVAQALKSLSRVLDMLGEYGEATERSERALAIGEKTLPKDDPEIATLVNDLATLHYAQGRYAQAKALFERALAIEEARLGPKDRGITSYLNNLGAAASEMGSHAEARAYLERALAIDEEANGPEDPQVAQDLNNLAQVVHAEGDLTKATRLTERALAIREKALGADHLSVAVSLNDLATLLQAAGRHDDARPLYERALTIRRRLLGDVHPAVAMTMNNLAELLHEQGSFAKARKLHERALAIRRESLGEDHPDVAASLGNLATVLLDEGDPSGARPLLEQALSIQERVHGNDHRDVGVALSNLAMTLQEQGALDEARPLFERSLAIFRKAFGEEHLLVAKALSHIAWLRAEDGDLAGAQDLYVRVLAIFESKLGKDHPDVAIALDNLAEVLHDRGALAEAQPLLERALAVLERTLGGDHPDTALALNNLGGLLQARGDLPGARRTYERALAVREKTLGADHLDVAAGHVNLAAVLVAQHAYREAEPHCRHALRIVEYRLRTGLLDLPPQRRVRLASSVRGFLDVWLACAPHMGVSGYDEVLRFKGLVSRVAQAEAQAQREAPDLAHRAVDETREVEAQLSRLANDIPPAGQAERQTAWKKAYAKAGARRERLATDLAKDLPGFQDALRRLDLGVSDVQGRLRPGEALVDVLRSRSGYRAWVVSREGAPVRLDLGSTADVEGAAEAFTQAIRSSGRGPADDGGAGTRLAALIWAPIAAALPAGTRTVYVSPDAALATVPLAALPSGHPGRYVVDDVSVVLLASAQDLVPAAASRRRGEGAVVVGGVDFDRATAGDQGELEPPANVFASLRAPAGRRFTPLAQTADEAAAAAKTLGTGAVVLTGAGATEAALRREVAGRRVLHVATHGFVRDDLMLGLRRREAEQGLFVGGLERHVAGGHDPMLLAGIAMAGANPRDGGHGDDGILTALEASRLDLSSCDLVVLSACETAAGSAVSGEGVLGLVSGFRIAGAARVVGSLWKVDDRATRLLMERFYEGMLRPESPLSPAEALRAAALWLRDHRDAGGEARFSAPRYWAAFVCYGR